jgi:hypothetical protein
MSGNLILKAQEEIGFGAYGGAELFFADINGDSRPEILAYQGPAVFGASNMHSARPFIQAAFPRSICLSAFGHDGRRLWTWGEPNPADRPYICHAHESCVAVGDIDGDGRAEVALANGRTVHVLEGATGKERASAELPYDNFYIVEVLGEPTGEREAALVVKNGEGGYDKWRYGEPLIALNARLKPVWGPVAIPGAGHHILSLDLDGDGRKEYLIGYCAVKPDGRIVWTLDSVDAANLNAGKDHVDYTDIRRSNSGETLIAFAGTSKAYLAANGGRTLFAQPGRHVQGCAIGRIRNDAEFHVAMYNDDGPMVLYDREGRELWQRPTPILWPLGMPKACEGRVFHRNRPVVSFSHKGRDWIVVSDGGWPWGMDGEGEITLQFDPPAKSKQPTPAGLRAGEYELPKGARGDDLGYGFATKVLDWDGDGNLEALVYDRRYLWVFKEPV